VASGSALTTGDVAGIFLACLVGLGAAIGAVLIARKHVQLHRNSAQANNLQMSLMDKSDGL
jgi:hypothetical protein